ncbi:Eukaryotic translation initiation factor 2-alpha kinase 1, partial [Chelonia mydas]
FSESDVPEELRVVNGSEKCYFTSTIANQLLLVSLLEHICQVYAQNPVQSRSLFQIICRTFTRMGLLSSFAFCDEFSTLRLQHNRAITQLMKAANQQIVLREVKVLAGLQHPNIVGYHTAWIEHVQQAYPKGEYYKTVLKLQSLKKSSDQEGGEDQCHIQNMESSSSIIFADYTSEEIKSSGYNFLENQDNKSVQHMDITKDFTSGDGEERIKTNKCEPLTDSQESCTDSTANGPVNFKSHLSHGLHSNLNKDIISSDSCTEDECFQKRPYHLVDVSWTLKFFQELLEGVYYIHSKGVMHRDIKSDMYSVGVILLELFQPFGTEMERTKILTSLRNGHVPSSFSSKWPVQTKYVKLLTSEMSSQRPTAAQLLESELFHNTENVICSLQQKVMQQEAEIEKLKEKIKLLSREKEREDRHKRLGSPV